ncbi:uncharacterized protein YndB with AHSA1/START domain [Kribbella voronezhensis]|uniref:Uncharacterized protein YndB with AHSA1/START domain n=1 Tax=Kribbella voronezhensis TaxID=2512212 RepID=A0A4R7SXQ9_9ACTN|nr:SRPBCC family protein [Kribbella voronezhensis]TDU83476.1 uncharacterized protein YndB with AHSA1/START domain [Kribbella voronezhensis]
MSSDIRGDEDLTGSLAAVAGKGVVRIEQRYDATIDDLWSAVVDPDRLARWYGRVEGDLRPGGTFRIHLDPADLDSTGRVEACEPPHRLLVSTRETDESWQRGQGPAPFDQTVEATLSAEGDRALLVIEVRGLPLDRVASFGAGWQIHAENLAAYLVGGAPVDVGARWQALLAGYQQLAAELG